ncbi:DNA-directed RNA polymerase subunit beta [Brevibacillus choshinensis]|uniref:DNA-directed RNA polymerase subunit beta n=1 Tax=Brevibacillus choshinensis TaxID=54911 RepID=UPI002E2221D0|nr:DNA-directed RNA polymerase subunit beta [Brevibacillus choshinensis]MED4751425.1 DNA-directed RNA polymerase subunit beta [Brevibacillus choshinensis]MED4780338.1 DNA-directed RNA polymerase subunit beta [Brevibacillus choshinensis]
MDRGKGQPFPRDTQEAKTKEHARRGKNWPIVMIKIVMVPLLLFFSLVIGLMIGYGVVGHKPTSEVFDLGTYKHMWDLLFAGT